MHPEEKKSKISVAAELMRFSSLSLSLQEVVVVVYGLDDREEDFDLHPERKKNMASFVSSILSKGFTGTQQLREHATLHKFVTVRLDFRFIFSTAHRVKFGHSFKTFF